MPAESVTRVFREIISACRGLEEALRVAYLGPEGTFSEQAVRKHFGGAVEAGAAASIDEVFRRCESGAAQFAVVPAENIHEGAVGRPSTCCWSRRSGSAARSSCACSRT